MNRTYKPTKNIEHSRNNEKNNVETMDKCELVDKIIHDGGEDYIYHFMNGICVFKGLIDNQTIEKLLIEANNKLKKSPNTMHKVGASDICDISFIEKIKNIADFYGKNYYDFDKKRNLVLFKDFTVHYDNNNLDKKLDVHYDDSDITVNICLKNTMEVSESTELTYYGSTNSLLTKKRNQKMINFGFQTGEIVIHKGKHLHSVSNVYGNGERVNLVMWFKYV